LKIDNTKDVEFNKKHMQKMTENIHALWQSEGSHLVQQNFEVFCSLVAQAKNYAHQHKYDVAAVYAEIAAIHALLQHCGLFVSEELERILLMIGQESIHSSLYSRKDSVQLEEVRNVLHVSTNISTYSGIPRLIRRWIQQDNQRSHSIALTTQAPNEVPKIFREIVFNSHGKIHILDEKSNSIISRARRLKEIAATADVVVLHIWEHDVIPTIAFANKEQSPPVIYVNHGDHWFWLGANISDVIANLRESGMRLSQQRRGIDVERNMLLPTVLEPACRKFSRAEAKRQLGIDEDSVLLLSIARAPKYRTIDDVNFAGAHVQLLNQYDQAILIVIGPSDSEDWSIAIEQVQGRIKVLGQTEETATFYQAADIYVDSFPFVSITSLLEAGSYGVPLVSRFPYSDACEIFGADMPGLTGNLIRVQNLKEYTEALSRLIEDEEFRLSIGDATRKKIEEIHIGSSWLRSLGDLYLRAITRPKIAMKSTVMDQIFTGEPDVFLPQAYGTKYDLEETLISRFKFMPFDERFHLITQLSKKYSWRYRIGLLLPASFLSCYSRLRDLLHI
jgi:glycosyltransferase involved in cell wall biosynthesis